MRNSLKALLAGAALAAIGTAAQAQYPYDYGYAGGRTATATLYELPNFGGRSVTITGENGNLSGVGFNDRARSARFEGTWTVCADANYRGHCETLSGSTAYLPPQLANHASSLRVTDGGWNPGQTPGWGGGRDVAVLYEYPNYQGRSVTVTRESTNLDSIGFNDRARSVRLEGSWRLCEDAGYRSRCETVTGSVPDLSRRGISGLSSLQMIGAYGGYPGYPSYPGAPAYGPSQGTSVVFYPGPVSAGGYGGAFPFGGSSTYGASSRRAADDFCRSMGHRSAAYYDTYARTLTDVLCRR